MIITAGHGIACVSGRVIIVDAEMKAQCFPIEG
jgi:hypothetical protein